MFWFKIIGWFLFSMPILIFIAFSFWMITSVIKDDSNVASFVTLMVVLWLIGFGMLILNYFFDIAVLTSMFFQA